MTWKMALEIFIAICIMFVYNFLFIKRILQNLDFENETFIYASNAKQIWFMYNFIISEIHLTFYITFLYNVVHIIWFVLIQSFL